MGFTRTHVRFERSHLHHIGQILQTRPSDGVSDPDVALLVKEEVRIETRHYRNIYFNRPDPILFLSPKLVVDTSGRLYDDVIRLTFLHDQSEESVLTNELWEESDQFRFLHAAC